MSSTALPTAAIFLPLATTASLAAASSAFVLSHSSLVGFGSSLEARTPIAAARANKR
eukprot:CAMPEP_0177503278 /NCGR_PEP_ID=MMETSP0369-20130122/38222_1 /TAXON_ID=447022 ORGANISM="Scrippsiella hangoei-like, Strain SHHI-4" /NCGR_SAMPLE_ID=MMETSP0369 /ASSEMBLY_ACC=CAM_ASM_000364 /LENGTH=56 /DNA_ID=CAMNT_0018980939 /DNA_START=82 /DNA_END=249 /DNA_ORIENTATION=-